MRAPGQATATLFPYTTLFRSKAVPKDPARAFPLLESYARVRLERSEEHTSELQSRSDLVCRLLLEKKKKLRNHNKYIIDITELRSAAWNCLFLDQLLRALIGR